MDVQKKKPGRKKGTGNNTERFEIRCQPSFNRLVDLLVNESWYFKGWTRTELLHELVRKASMSAFVNDSNKNIEGLINSIIVRENNS